MEDDTDDLDNLFEEHEDQPNENADKEASNEASESVKVPVPKRVVKNPRLKFNAERLCGERGIPVLVDCFKDVRFRGKGFEKEDLNKLLARLEHWTHRLFPSMKFEDSLRQIEKLGKKRAVQTCLHKIRLDMPILSSDFIHDDEEKDDVQRIDDEMDEVQRIDDVPAPIDPFDALIGNTQRMPSPAVNIPLYPPTPVVEEPRGHILGSSLGSSLTDEQRKRMDYNRMLAAERRKAKLMSSQPLSNTMHDEFKLQSVSPDASNEHSNSNTINLDEYDNSNKLIDKNDSFQHDACASSEASMSVANDDLTEEMKRDENIPLSKVSDCENSERLKLDDLMDLIESDEPCQERSDLVQPDSFNSIEATPVVTDELMEEMEGDKSSTLPKVLYNDNSEQLKLDELMDLIEDDKPCLPLKDSEADANVCDLNDGEMAANEASSAFLTPSHENVQSQSTDILSNLINHKKYDAICNVNDTPVKSCLNKLLDIIDEDKP